MKMKKRFDLMDYAVVFVIGLIVLIMVAALFFGEESIIRYEGELRPVSEVEEIISDKLEVENPTIDLEVRISEDTE